MIPYDQGFDPPAPVVEVVVYHPQTTGPGVRFQAQLDPGSDISVIPRQALDEIVLPASGEIMTIGYDGVATRTLLYFVILEVGGWLLPPLEIAVMPRDALLGRDVLNHFVITLNGKEQQFELRDP
jgi:predicted aspartyl protease